MMHFDVNNEIDNEESINAITATQLSVYDEDEFQELMYSELTEHVTNNFSFAQLENWHKIKLLLLSGANDLAYKLAEGLETIEDEEFSTFVSSVSDFITNIENLYHEMDSLVDSYLESDFENLESVMDEFDIDWDEVKGVLEDSFGIWDDFEDYMEESFDCYFPYVPENLRYYIDMERLASDYSNDYTLIDMSSGRVLLCRI